MIYLRVPVPVVRESPISPVSDYILIGVIVFVILLRLLVIKYILDDSSKKQTKKPYIFIVISIISPLIGLLFYLLSQKRNR